MRASTPSFACSIERDLATGSTSLLLRGCLLGSGLVRVVLGLVAQQRLPAVELVLLGADLRVEVVGRSVALRLQVLQLVLEVGDLVDDGLLGVECHTFSLGWCGVGQSCGPPRP